MLAEQGVSALDNVDVSKLTEDNGTRGLDSPSKMVAINLANGNPIFREKLRLKLEQSGGLHYDLDTSGVFVKRGKDGSSRKSGSSQADDDGDLMSTPGTNDRRRMKSKKSRQFDDESNDGSEDGRRGGGESSLMKRRRKAELSIGVPASQLTDMGPPEDTPGTKIMKYRSGLPSSSGNLHCMLESPLSLEKHVGFESGYPISADTPTLSKLMNLIPPMSKTIGSDLKFDFDEVVQHFHSPRTQLEVAARWGGVAAGQQTNLDSTTSIGSIDSVFNFSIDGPLSKASKDAVDSMYRQSRDPGNMGTAGTTPSHGEHGFSEHGGGGGVVFSSSFPSTPGQKSNQLRSVDSSSRNVGSGSQQQGSNQKLVSTKSCYYIL